MHNLDLKNQPLPSYFKHNIYEISFKLPTSQKKAFDWLLRKKTFTRGQIPPYKVEFIPENSDEFMQVGDFTNHHGPLIQFAGVMTEITKTYRRLDYLYGSYALSFRLIRPVCLEVWVEDLPLFSTNSKPKALVKLKLTTGVHKWINLSWTLLMKFFWPQFALNAKILWWFKNLIKS